MEKELDSKEFTLGNEITFNLSCFDELVECRGTSFAIQEMPEAIFVVHKSITRDGFEDDLFRVSEFTTGLAGSPVVDSEEWAIRLFIKRIKELGADKVRSIIGKMPVVNKMRPAQSAEDGWIKWDGSVICPIPWAKKGEYEIKFSYGIYSACDAVHYCWADSEIIAYRMSTNPQKVSVDENGNVMVSNITQKEFYKPLSQNEVSQIAGRALKGMERQRISVEHSVVVAIRKDW